MTERQKGRCSVAVNFIRMLVNASQEEHVAWNEWAIVLNHSMIGMSEKCLTIRYAYYHYPMSDLVYVFRQSPITCAAAARDEVV